MKNTTRRWFIALASVFVVSTQAQIVLDESFEGTELGPGQQRTPAPGETPWTFSASPSSAVVRLFINGVYNSDAPHGVNAMYLWANFGNYGSVEQTVTLPGKGRYRLSYYEAGREPAIPAHGGGNTTYTITLGGTELATKTTTTFQQFEVEEVLFDGDPGTYLLKFVLTTATEMNNMALFDLIAIEQLPEAMTIDVPPQAGHVPIGGRATFSVSVAGVPLNEVAYQWLKDDTELVGATTSTLTIDNTTTDDQGMYSVRVTHTPSAQAITTSPVTLTVSEFALESSIAVEIRFPSEQGKTYQLQASSDLDNWTNVGDPILGTGALIVEYYSTNGAKQRYLRVQEL
jgi:hypothetical protein